MSGLTCLRCKHAALVAKDNLNVICCGKQNQKIVDINLLGCKLADPEWSTYGGDKLRNIGSVEAAFLEKYYNNTPIISLMRATQRSRYGVLSAGFHQGLKRPFMIPDPRSGLKNRKDLYSHQQKEYLKSITQQGLWPMKGETDLRNHILEELNKLGPPKTWANITSWKYTQTKKYNSIAERNKRAKNYRDSRKRRSQRRGSYGIQTV